MTAATRPAWLALSGTVACALALAWLQRSPHGWSAWRQASCMPAHCFCERVRDAAVRQPVNAWSSLAFVAVGIWIAALPRRGADAGLRDVHRTVFAAAVIAVGLGSAFYHATLSFAGQFSDAFGMYLLATFVVLNASAQPRNVRPAVVVLAYVAFNVILAVLLYTLPSLRRYLFAIVITAGALLEVRLWRTHRGADGPRWLLLALGVLLLGFAAWIVDITHMACDPTGLIQGHAVWHVASAGAAVLLFRHYASRTLAAS
ncbi:MAG TPA: ceramidase domain-containing protein [Longimicrobium sp.]|nr:ceramidase domain-containing protein [Longimicrobium sp.]